MYRCCFRSNDRSRYRPSHRLSSWLGRCLSRSLLAGLLLGSSVSASAEYTILFLGDSLTEGYGLEPSQSFPGIIEQRLHDAGREDIKVINGGVSGATSASALNRLQWYIRSQPDFMLLALGANDGLRGLSIEQMRANLVAAIEHAQANGIRVALAGMMIPPNYGQAYANDFADVFPDLAATYDLPFLPFLLEGVAAIESMNQADGIHPNAEGTRRVADLVYDFILPLLPSETEG